MADPLSILASVVGVSAAAAHTAKKIKEYIDTIQNVPEVVSSISSETAILRSTLLSLSSTIESDDNLQDPDIDPRFVQPFVSLKTLLEDCQRSFLSIRRAIEPYVEVDTRSKRRKWKLAATWKDHKKALEYVKRDLLSYKMSLDIALNFAMFLTTSAGNAAIQKQISQLQEQLAMTQTEAMLNIAPEVENIPADRNFALRHFLWETESTIGLEQDPNNSERQNLEDYDGDVVDGEDEDFERHQSLTKRTNASEEDPLSDTDSERSRHPDHPSPRPVKATDAQEEQYYDCLSYNTGDASTALIQPVVIAAASSDDCTKLGIPVNVHQFHPAQHQTASDSKHVIVIQGSSSSSNRNGKASRRYSFGLASSMYDSLCDEKNRLRFSFGLIPVAQDCTRPVFKSGDIVWMMEKVSVTRSIAPEQANIMYRVKSRILLSKLDEGNLLTPTDLRPWNRHLICCWLYQV